jgi:hypothetical protein
MTPALDDLPSLLAMALPKGVPSTVIDHDTGVISNIWTFTMTPAPSTPIQECKDVTAAERKALAERTPPYDGVRVWGDLLAVRAKTKPKDT